MQGNLSKLGYQQYEISSYALPGQESQHNRIYWSQGSYLGLGPGAHSMRFNPDGSIVRRHTQAQLAEWLRNPAEASFQEELLTPQEALLESLAFGIRDLVRGICPQELANRHQTSLPNNFENLMQGFIKKDWAIRHCEHSNDKGKYRLTPTGARFADAIAREILGLQR
jgi:oxygen-independent coproporphyrinogen-3 oxidase